FARALDVKDRGRAPQPRLERLREPAREPAVSAWPGQDRARPGVGGEAFARGKAVHARPCRDLRGIAAVLFEAAVVDEPAQLARAVTFALEPARHRDVVERTVALVDGAQLERRLEGAPS